MRWIGVRAVFALTLAVTSLGLAAPARGISFPGAIQWPAGDNQCANTSSPDPNLASTTITLKYPNIFATAAHNAAHPGIKQKVTVLGKLETNSSNGVRSKYGFLNSYTGLAGFGSEPFIPTLSDEVIPNLEMGNIYSVVYFVSWYDLAGTTVVDQATVENGRIFALSLDGVPATTSWLTPNCTPVIDPQVTPVVTSGTVNQNVKVYLRYAFADVPTCVICNQGSRLLFDNTQLSLVELAESKSEDVVRFKVPTATAGVHTIKLQRFDGAEFSANFTVKPRIKITPSSGSRGTTVNVSLRGYSRGENVRVRWQQGGRFVTLTTVRTSNTGSANVDVTVPEFAPDGPQNVRGDGERYRAQTNVFNVSGGLFVAAERSEKRATPSPTAPPAETVTASPTAEVTAEPTLEPTAEPTLEPNVEPTLEPTEEPTLAPTLEPTEEPSLEPTPEPSSEPTGEATPAVDGTVEAALPELETTAAAD